MREDINWARIAWWSKQQQFDRTPDGLLFVGERVARLKKMHDFFGTRPKASLGHSCETRELLMAMFTCEN